MSIELRDLTEFIQKAAMYDAIMNYIRTTEYVSKADILAFAGEKEVKQNEGEKIGG